MFILCLNSGSSSFKFALYSIAEKEEKRLAHGAVEPIGFSPGRLWIKGADDGLLVDLQGDFPGHEAAIHGITEAAKHLGFPPPDAAGHRVVHGGPEHSAPERVDASLVQYLRRLVPFAPLHLPSAIVAIEVVTARFPGMPQVACFDTAFHRRLPEIAQLFPLSRHLWDGGIRRYGFHGLSYEYILATLGTEAKGRLIVAHLGNGASLAAVLNGRPVETTMGFTPAGGVMMGTRSGDLDPGILLYLMREERLDSAQLDDMVNHQSGLLGVSGISSDMRDLLALQGRDPQARQAVELFCYQLRKTIGALTAVLGGLDTLVFTGGIGEHAAEVRWEVSAGLGYLGITLDPQLNTAHAEVISSPESDCIVRVIPTNEDLMIARHTHSLIFEAMLRY